MIWIHKGPSQLDRPQQDELPRAFWWLLFQTFVFGAIAFAIFLVATHTPGGGVWMAPFISVALLGFAGGLIGIFIVLAVAYARDDTDH